MDHRKFVAHRDLAGEERVVLGVDVGAAEDRARHRDVVRPHAAVPVLPGRLPGVGDLGGLAVGAAGEGPGPEVGAHAAQVVALRLEAPLDDVLGVEARLGGVLAVLVDGQDLRDLADGVVVPVDLGAVGHLVLLAVRVRRLGEARLVEQALGVEQDRRVDRERDADLALVQLVDVDRVGREPGQVIAVLLDQRRRGPATGRGRRWRRRCRPGPRCRGRCRTRSRWPGRRSRPRTGPPRRSA